MTQINTKSHTLELYAMAFIKTGTDLQLNQLSIYQLITFVKQGMFLLNMLLCKENDLSVLFFTT